MNILVTGANGQLGNEMRILADRNSKSLFKGGFEGVPTTHGSQLTADNYLFTDVNQIEGVETIYLDITDLQAIRQMVSLHDIKVIVNCAAYTNVDAAETNQPLAELLNATAPQNLAIAMNEVGGLLVHISTDYVFGAEPYNTPCKEDQTGTPTGIYGLTKLHGELNIINVAKSNEQSTTNSKLTVHCSQLAYVIIRTAWLYSEFGKNFVKTMINLTATKPELKVVFDQVGTPTYALDLAKAILTVINDYKQAHSSQLTGYTKSGVYHYSNEGVCSWYDFTKMIQQTSLQLKAHDSELIAQCNVQPCYSSDFPSPVKRPSYSVLDKGKIRTVFGVEVPYWTDSLKVCIANLKAQNS